MKARIGLAIALFGFSACSEPLPPVAKTEYRDYYLAPPRGFEPCPDNPKTTCAIFRKEDAVVRLRVHRSVHDEGAEVHSRILFMRLRVTPQKILLGTSAPGESAERLQPDLISGKVDLALSLAPEAAQRDVAFFLKGGLGDQRYVKSTSRLPGFEMYEVDGCQDYEATQFDYRGGRVETHPKFQRRFVWAWRRVFVPLDRKDAWFQCALWLLENGRMREPHCRVNSYYSPGLLQSYDVPEGALTDGSWVDVDRRLREFILSLRVPL